MSDANSSLLPLMHHTANMMAERTARVPGAFGEAYFSFYFSYFSFNKSLPAGRSVV